MLSSYHGHADIVRLLLSFSADPNRLNDRGQSVLAGAVFKMHSEVIETLLEGVSSCSYSDLASCEHSAERWWNALPWLTFLQGADPMLGQPNALDSAKMFKQEQWVEKFERASQKLGDLGQGARNGH